MIWNNSSIAANPELEMLATHIAAEIRSAGLGDPESPEMPDGNELARSVAEFVYQRSPCFRRRSESYPGFAEGPVFSEASPKASYAEASGGKVAGRHELGQEDSAGASDGILIPSDYLLIMTCRALWAVGREQAARALLRTKGSELNISESYADAVFGKGLFPCLGMHSALVRALRPSSSLWSMNGPCWILNLRTVFSFLDAGLELTIWRILHALTKQLAVLWDVSNGKGTLGLNDSRYLSANVLGFPRKSKQGRQFTAELIRYCEQDLKIAAAERNWRFAPMVMNIDG